MVRCATRSAALACGCAGVVAFSCLALAPRWLPVSGPLLQLAAPPPHGTGVGDPADPGMERIGVYSLQGGLQSEPSHLDPVPQSLLMPNGSLTIDEAHRSGLAHGGMIILILDAEGRQLLLRRAATLMTCPGTWGMLGEHQHEGEPPEALMRRAIEEELGPQVLPLIASSVSLADGPVWYRRDYSSGRIDRQATLLWAACLRMRGEDVPLAPDSEVAEYKWATPSELEGMLNDDPTPFCHESVLSLLRLSVRLLSSKQCPVGGR